MRKTLLVAQPRGFCAGVDRAVRTVEQALRLFGPPVYVKHEIVHNRHVVAALEGAGAITAEHLDDVPNGATVVFSAHGSPPAHYREAKRRKWRVVDATCPLVTKVHLEMRRFISAGYTVVYIGHRGHIEGVGVIGEAGRVPVAVVENARDVEALPLNATDKIAYLTQTTLSLTETAETIVALRKRFPQIKAPPRADICFATSNRQQAVQELAKQSQVVLVFGSRNSSNSNRLCELARQMGKPAYLVDDIGGVQEAWWQGRERVGVSAGASAPEQIIAEALDFFRARGFTIEELRVLKEDLQFTDPPELLEYVRNSTAAA